MTQSIDNRPGVDTKIVQTSVLRGCDALFPGDRDGVLLTIRGADVQDGGTPGDVYVQPGLNVTSDAVSTVYHLSRSREEQDPIFMLVGGVDTSSTSRFAVHGGVTPPEGIIFARESSLFFDHTTPGLWIKTTDDTLNTGWEQLATVNVTAEDLEETLQIGNVTGALPIIVNNTNSGLHGEDGVGANGISYTIRAGNSGGANGGALDVLAGAVSAGGGNGGNLRLAAGASTGGAAGGFGGGVAITAGLSGGANDGGSVSITAGVGGPNAGGGGGDIDMTAGAGIGGVGGTITAVGGAGGAGSSGGALLFTAGAGAPGGAVEIKSGPGAGALAAGGPVTIAAGDPDAGGGPGANVLISASDAIGAFTGGNITLDPGTGASGDGAVIVNGKLTVTGIIDPIGLIFQETPGDADVPVPGTEGGIYVSDGSSGRTQNALYYKDDSGNHFQLAPPAGGSSFVEAFGRVTWGYLSVSSDSGLEVDSVGRLNGHTITTNAGAITSRTASSQGASLTLGSGATTDTSYSSLETNSTLLRRDSRPLFVFKFQLAGNSTAQRVFIGVSNQGPAYHANANFPSGGGGEYAGITVAAGTGNFNFTSHSSSGGGLYTGTSLAIDLDVHYLVMDMTVSDRITWTLLDEDFNVELTNTNSLATSLPLSGSFLDVMIANGTSDAVVNNLRFFHCNMIERADALAQAFGGGAAPLSTVLALGNTTGGNDIQFDNGDIIRGTDDGAGADGGSLLLTSGNTSSAAGDSGDVFIFTNAVTNVAASGDTGTISVTTGPISLAGQTGDTGDLNLGTGGTVGPGASGDVVIATGTTVSTEAGAIQLLAGGSTGDEGGFIQLLAGDSAGVGLQGGLVNITAGDSGDAQGGNVEVFGGNATAGNNDGGSIVLTPGTGAGTGSDGVVFVAGKLTVTGIIDPTGLVLDNQAAVPEGTPAAGKSTLWVRSSDNALIVTDDAGVDTPVGTGGGSTTLAGLTDVTITAPGIGEVLTFNGVDWENAPSTAGGGTLNLAQALGEIAFGAFEPGSGGIAGNGGYEPASVTSISGGGVVLDTQGQAEGPYSIFFTDNGLALNHGGWFGASRRTNMQGRCFSTVKFFLNSMATAADPQFFAGWSSGSTAVTSVEGQLDSANVPTFHVGVEIDELNNPGETTFYFTFDEDGTGKTRVNTGVAFSPAQILYLTIDATVANAVTVSLYDASYSQLATHTFATTPTLIDYSPMCGASTSNAGNTRFDHFYFRNVWRADLVAALSGVGAADLATVLATGNTSGGNDIILTAGDNIQGEDSGAPSTLNITAGSTTATGVNGANLALAAGSASGAAGDNGGTVTLLAQSGTNNAAGDGGVGGSVLMNTGFGGDTTLAGSAGGDGGTYSLLMGSGGDSTTGAAGGGGPFVITTGDGGDAASGTAGVGGRLRLITGDGGTDSASDGGDGGIIELNPGNGGVGNGGGNSGGAAQGVSITGGTGGAGLGGADGGDGGPISIVAGSGGTGATSGDGGLLTLASGAGGATSEAGSIVLNVGDQAIPPVPARSVFILGGAEVGSTANTGAVIIAYGHGEAIAGAAGFATLAGGTAEAASGDGGGGVSIQGGAGDGIGGGGRVQISGGVPGASGLSGQVDIVGQFGTSPGSNPGAVTLSGATNAGPGSSGGGIISVTRGVAGTDAGDANISGGMASVASGEDGGNVLIQSGNGDGAGVNGVVHILGGTFAPPLITEGSVLMRGADNAGSGSEGAFVLAVASVGSTSGSVVARGGDAAGASGDSGGDITIQAGDGDGAGANGSITLTPGTGGTGGGTIDFDGLIDRDADGYKHATFGPTAAASNPIAFATAFPAGPPPTINVMIETTGAGAVPPVYFIHTVGAAGFTLEFAAAPPAGTLIHWTARQ